MSKWRGAEKNSIFVIPDVHGAYNLLAKICDRILPLRKSDGGKDQIVFLGDYIDRCIDSHKTLDLLIELEERYPKQVTFIEGNHELILKQALNIQPGKNMNLLGMNTMYQMWMREGGRETVAGYKQRLGISNDDWKDVPRNQILPLLPKEHINFLTTKLQPYYEIEDYIFVHGGCNPQEPVINQDPEFLAWDRGLLKFVQNNIQQENIQRTSLPLPWEKTVVCGHSVQGDRKPVIVDKFMMLDCGAPHQLLVVELRSGEAYMAKPGQRLVKFELEKTKKKPGLIRRIST